MKSNTLPSIKYLHECFREEDGVLYWKERPLSHFANKPLQDRFNRKYPGKVAGTEVMLGHTGFRNRKYRIIFINGYHRYLRSRIIFAMNSGKDLGNSMIDHADNDSMNDRFSNLRVANRSQNGANSKSTSKTGFKGVYSVRDKYRAQIRLDNKTISLGYFGNPAEAHAAYMEAAEKHYGEFARSQ